MILSGIWSFQLDADDIGIRERWFDQQLAQRIQLPGSLQAQGFGAEVSVATEWVGQIVDRSWFVEQRFASYRQPGQIKVPFWLQPEKHYSGVAWYQREIEIPEEWRGRRVRLFLERPHWETRAWLDDCALGRQTSLSTPHVYELEPQLEPGRHRLTLRVDNRMIVNVGPNSHSISDHTQTNWNGIVGRIALEAGSPVWLENLQLYPRIRDCSLRVRLRIGNLLARSGRARVTLTAEPLNVAGRRPQPATFALPFSGNGTSAEIVYQLGADVQLWDEFSPTLYRLHVRLDVEVDGRAYSDRRSVSFGMREVSVQGTQIAINGRPIFLRGTLDCAVFPLTGYPPTDVQSWRRIIKVCKAHGLNHLRFHSWCPPEAAFQAADELGFYYQVECGSWANQGAALGEGDALDCWLYEEGRRITTAYANHPSFMMMAYGNEPAGRIEDYLGVWVSYWCRHEPRCVHTSGAGWPAIPENDYHCIPEPRIQQWGDELRSRINALPPETRSDYRDYVARLGKPIVSHEIGQWCAYPNFDEIAKYTGLLKARNFEIFRDLLEAHHMGDQARDFLYASGKLQVLCYKEEIEAALRTPGFAGFQLLGLNDFPGQGTALVGVLDSFWESKGYVAPEEFRRFCAATVPLARMDKLYWRSSETLLADVEIAHFGPAALDAIVATWRLLDEQSLPVARGTLPPARIPTGAVTRLGALEIPLAELATARRYRLEIRVGDSANDWDIWLFAEQLQDDAPDVLLTQQLDAQALARLAEGGAVLLLLPPAQVAAQSQIGFSSIFWNTAWTKQKHVVDDPGQAPHTLGILCDPAHPALAAFPTERHSNWQWWELIYGAAAMPLDHLPPALRPIIQPIDTWFEARRLGLLFEARVGGGRLLICSIDLSNDLERRPVARQLRHSLLRYAGSAAFVPQVELSPGAITMLTK